MLDFDVMMVGGSGAGKTSFVGAMYRRFGATSFKGFSLLAEDIHQREVLDELGKSVEKGVYPDSTNVASQYSFFLHYKDTDVVRFNLSDYRGEALSARFENGSHERAELVERIVHSDALIVFFDSVQMVNNDDYSYYMNNVSRIVQKVINRVGVDSDFPISVVFTKMDALNSKDELLSSSAYRFFWDTIRRQIENNSSIKGLVSGLKIGAKFLWWHYSRNVEYPFLHIFFHLVSRERMYHLLNYNQKVDEANSFTPSFWNSIWCAITEEKSEREKMRECRKQASEIMDVINSLNGPMEAINTFLSSNTTNSSDNLSFRL